MENQNKLSEQWARETLEKIALAGIKEQRTNRRWHIIKWSITTVFLVILFINLFSKGRMDGTYDDMGNVIGSTSTAHIAMVHLSGAIASETLSSSEQLSATLRRAAANDGVQGIVIVANSPGGSPVQSSLVYQTIRDIKASYKKPVLTAITDTCASGCYYIVSASDEIYADRSSVVGSIGVISQSFGYQQAAEKLGIELRTYTAGENKDFLNPAREPTEKEIAFLKSLLDELHQNFITAVKRGRGNKLSENSELFSGLFWTGEQAQHLGLIDGISTPHAVAKKIGDYPVYDYSALPPWEDALRQLGIKAQSVFAGGIKQLFKSQNEIKFQ